MQKYKNIMVTCPHCGKSFKVKQFTYIQSSTMGRERNRVLNDTIFQELCPYCHTRSIYPYSFTFHEPKNNMDLIYAKDEEDRDAFLEEYEGKENVRICTTNDDLVEKIMIFHERYNDHVMEVVKTIVQKVFKEDTPELDEVRFSYNNSINGPYGPVIIGIVNGFIQQMVPVDKLYDETYEQYEDIFDSYRLDSLIVDQSWAEAFNKEVGLHAEMLKADVKKEEETEGPGSFFDQVAFLETEGNEKKAAELIVNNFDSVWKEILTGTKGKPKLHDLDERYDGLYNTIQDFDMILMNERKYQECMHVLKTILDTVDLSDNRLIYMNLRRAYMECLGQVKSFDEEKAYLEAWMKEDPKDPYLYGTEIDLWLDQDIAKAKELASKYVDTPIDDLDDEWLLDSCENVAREIDDKELLAKVEAARKRAYHVN